MRPEMKPAFEERMRMLLPDSDDFTRFNEIIHQKPRNFIRCNTLKMSPKNLIARLRKRWEVRQPYPDYPEIMLVTSQLQPGELGSSLEHLLGYYYIQEISSMMSVLALNPEPEDHVFDMCASPGSKTTQIAARMNNEGFLVANDVRIDRIAILSANLERCGVMNCAVTREDGIGLCVRLAKKGMKFDKILLDAPCSGEGTLRSSPKTFMMWNTRVLDSFGRQQKKMIAVALGCLRPGGTLVYSTCTHAPEENEAVIDFAVQTFPVSVEKINLPLECRPGVRTWKSKEFDRSVSNCCRIYPQDNDSEGFFVARLHLKEAA